MITTNYRILGLVSCLAILAGTASTAIAQTPSTPLPIATPNAGTGGNQLPIADLSNVQNIDPSQFLANPQQFLQGVEGAQNVMKMLQGGQIDAGQIAQQLANLGNLAGGQIGEATKILQGLSGMMQNGEISPAAVQNIVGGMMGGQIPEGLANLMGTTNPAALGSTLNNLFGGGATGATSGTGGSSGGSGSGGSKDKGNYELASKPVNAGPAAGGCGVCADVGAQIKQHYTSVRQLIKNKFIEHRKWIVTEYWKKHVLPALMLMAEQLTVVGIQQVEIFGTMLDAKHQLETQRLFQQMTAEAHKDYQPSEGMCTFGTSVRSLAASERKSDLTQVGLAGRMMQRQTLSGDTVSYIGPSVDIESRLVYFTRNFCDKADNSNGLVQLCKDANTLPHRRNIDVDFTRNIESRLTLDIDFADTEGNISIGSAQRAMEAAKKNHEEEVQMLEELKQQLKETEDPEERSIIINTTLPSYEQRESDAFYKYMQSKEALSKLEKNLDKDDVFALSANLFAHNVAPRLLPEQLATDDGRVKQAAAEKYLDLRSIFAKRSVAQNSFAALTAMRSSGDEGSAPYTKALIKELGVADEDEINKLLGEKPSYFAQMEVLTKKIYQNPTFYTELYDKPVNVERKGAAIQAIGLMQDRDLYNSLLRSEAVLSVLLETMLIREQEKVVAGMPRDPGAAGGGSQ